MDIKITEDQRTSPKKVIGTQISLDMYDRLKEEAENEFMSISDLLRKIIFKYYAQNERK